MGEKPVYLIIDVVHQIKQGSGSPVYITSSIDMLQYYCGVDSYNDVTSKSFGGSGSFLSGQTGIGGVFKAVTGWFKQAVDKSVQNGNNKNRLSNLSNLPVTNGWAWAIPAILHGGRPTTISFNSAGGLLTPLAFLAPKRFSRL